MSSYPACKKCSHDYDNHTTGTGRCLKCGCMEYES